MIRGTVWWLVFVSVVYSAALCEDNVEPALNEGWQSFKKTHAKTYDSPRNEIARRQIWETNMKYIQRHNVEYNAGVHSYSLGMNAFGDWSFEEFKSHHAKRVKRRNITRTSSFLKRRNVVDLPVSVDWRSKGLVNPVKDQGQCGSCYAFSAVGSIEGQYAKKTGKLEMFSEQQLVDCSQSFGNQGCNGGFMDQVFDYVQQYGIERESDYPYTAMDTSGCHYDASKVVTKVSGYVYIPEGNEDSLKEAVATVGPVSVAIDVSHASFQFYKNGIYNEMACSSTDLDHGVLLVGYSDLNNVPYWLVANQWGTSWGQQGYIFMSRNKNNQCGIATAATYPLI